MIRIRYIQTNNGSENIVPVNMYKYIVTIKKTIQTKRDKNCKIVDKLPKNMG